MAQTNINLLPYEQKEQERFSALQKKLSKASIAFLTIVAIFTVVTLVFYTSLASERSRLVSRVEEGSKSINNQKAQEELVVVIKNKVNAADKILTGRTNYPTFFEEFTARIPQGVYFLDFKVTGSKFSTSGKARSSADIAGLIASLTSAEGSKLVNNVAIGSLGLDEKGVYSFSLTGQLSKKE